MKTTYEITRQVVHVYYCCVITLFLMAATMNVDKNYRRTLLCLLKEITVLCSATFCSVSSFKEVQYFERNAIWPKHTKTDKCWEKCYFYENQQPQIKMVCRLICQTEDKSYTQRETKNESKWPGCGCSGLHRKKGKQTGHITKN